MDLIPFQPSSLSFFKPYPAASCTDGMGWRASGSFGLMDWTARNILSTSEHSPQSSRGRRQVRFPTTGQISMVSTSKRTKSCPLASWALIPQLTGRYVHLQSSASQPPAETSPFLPLDLLFLGSAIRTVSTEMSFHPAPMIQKWLWIGYLRLTQFILNRIVKSKQSCNETFLIFKEQISGVSG